MNILSNVILNSLLIDPAFNLETALLTDTRNRTAFIQLLFSNGKNILFSNTTSVTKIFASNTAVSILSSYIEDIYIDLLKYEESLTLLLQNSSLLNKVFRLPLEGNINPSLIVSTVTTLGSSSKLKISNYTSSSSNTITNVLTSLFFIIGGGGNGSLYAGGGGGEVVVKKYQFSSPTTMAFNYTIGASNTVLNITSPSSVTITALKGNNANGLYGGLGGGSNINNENVNRSILSDILWFDKEFNFSGGDGGDGGIVTNEFGQNGKRGFWGSGGKKGTPTISANAGSGVGSGGGASYNQTTPTSSVNAISTDYGCGGSGGTSGGTGANGFIKFIYVEN